MQSADEGNQISESSAETNVDNTALQVPPPEQNIPRLPPGFIPRGRKNAESATTAGGPPPEQPAAECATCKATPCECK
ncbi:hypothetical protein QCA50_001874 [Cerrena zonata]|uniref:Uncharacterized protein n=1 Tax=Cerrena zonata TaxID=2478898 RepID=A0AAW0GMK0_9APHY